MLTENTIPRKKHETMFSILGNGQTRRRADKLFVL
jgi:hypothetical protein